jgi:5-methylcytosine-specific restriction enzyme subunit McrC
LQLPGGALAEAEGRGLSAQYGQQVEVQSPSLFNPYWTLTAQDWVGHIPVSPELNLALKPKVELHNLFRMWEYAYRLNRFRLLEGLVQCQSLAEFYQQLAHILARRILERGRQGLYRAYVAETERLPYVRGRLEVRQSIQSPGQVKLHCHYEEHTADIEDNQILAWTLWHIIHSSPVTERVLPTVRQAYRMLQGLVTLTPYGPQVCANRLYHRLNEDYHPLHALCRFFLDQSGPGHRFGDRMMLPFLVDMARLFELFVAEWLKAQPLPNELVIKEQEKVDISRDRHYKIDLVLSDRTTGQARYVLDTKYKTGDIPTDNDIHQVVAYATAKFCQEAVLIYPAPLAKPLTAQVGNVRVRSLTFSLASDLEQAGQVFLQNLLKSS